MPETITKKVLISFTCSKIKAADHYNEIKDAVEKASHNLFVKHKVIVRYPLVRVVNSILITLEIPKDKSETFRIGNHLRGIANYLVKSNREYYDQYYVGNQLISYVDISDFSIPSSGFINEYVKQISTPAFGSQNKHSL